MAQRQDSKRERVKRLFFGLFLMALVVLDSVSNPAHMPLEELDSWEVESTIESETSIDTLFDRYLQADDDRHSNGPNEEDATNSPTILGYSKIPSVRPSLLPTVVPSSLPTLSPSELPSSSPTVMPTEHPTKSPSSQPSIIPSNYPSLAPSDLPSSLPTMAPSLAPSVSPSSSPTNIPSLLPTKSPSLKPTSFPSNYPSSTPSDLPSSLPTMAPSLAPSVSPSSSPTNIPSLLPTKSPSLKPTSFPSNYPSLTPSDLPSSLPTMVPSLALSVSPSSSPTSTASEFPTSSPTSGPSLLPTKSPSLKPSSIPSSHPSVFPSDLPSSLPSKLPSSAPSLDPCKGYDGNFGDINGELRFTIFFNYGVESDKTVETNMKATLSEQVKEVEQAMLDLLIARFFEDCNERRNLAGLNIFLGGDVNSHPADGVEFSDSDLERPFNVKKDKTASLTGSPTSTSNPHTREVVGISSSPVDLANGKKCAGDYKNDPQFDAECNVIEGRLTVYLSDIAFSNSTNVAMLQEIKSMMNEDLLDDCHPAILSVMFMTPSITVARSPVDDDFFEEETTVATAPPGGILMIALVGTIGMVVLVSFTRYRYSSQFKDDGSGELRELHDNTNIGSERFVEIDLSTPSMDRGLP